MNFATLFVDCSIALLLVVAAVAMARILSEQPITRFRIRIEGGNMDLQILDDGKGVKYTAVPDHALKADEKPTWSVSDASVLSIDYDPTDGSGLTAIGQPLKDGVGIVATITLIRHDGATITQAADPIDIVPDPNAEVGGFVIQEAAL